MFADRLRSLARDIDRLGKGEIKPHTKETEIIGNKARIAIRDLAEWL